MIVLETAILTALKIIVMKIQFASLASKFILVFFLLLFVVASCKKESTGSTGSTVSLPPVTTNKPPIANAGTGQTIILPTDSTELIAAAQILMVALLIIAGAKYQDRHFLLCIQIML